MVSLRSGDEEDTDMLLEQERLEQAEERSRLDQEKLRVDQEMLRSSLDELEDKLDETTTEKPCDDHLDHIHQVRGVTVKGTLLQHPL